MLGPAEFPGSCLLPLMSQTNTQTHRGPGSALLPLRTQTHGWISQDVCFLPIHLEVPGSLTPKLAEILAQA